MSDASWSCDETARRMEDYQRGMLPGPHARAIARHLMCCSSCHDKHWRPMFHNLEEGCSRILDALCADLPPELPVERGQTWGELPVAGSSYRRPPAPGAPDVGAPAGPPEDVMGLEVASQAGLRPTGVQLEGTSLPPIPLTEQLTGYHLDVNARGELGPVLPDALARVHVRASSARLKVRSEVTLEVRLEALAPGVTSQGETVPVGEAVLLRHIGLVVVGDAALRFEPGAEEDPWTRGRAGLLWLRGRRIPLPRGETTLGRSPTSTVPLPDRGTAVNLHWHTPVGVQAAQAPARIALDSYRVGREHAVLRWSGQRLGLEVRSRYGVRIRLPGGDVLEAFPGQEAGALRDLGVGAQLMVGQQIFALVAGG